MDYLISVDIGTTALKSSLTNRDGKIIASVSGDYPLIADGSKIEQDPRLWWDTFCRTVKELTATQADRKITAVVLSGQMQDLIRIEAGELTGNAILYSDTRAQEEYERFASAFGYDRIRQITMNTPDASGLPAKIMMLKADKKLSDDTQILLGAHDVVCWYLTGRMVTDPTNASTTGLMNYQTGDWDGEILEFLGIDALQLPQIEAASTITGIITEAAAEACGLAAGTPVIHGAGDAASSTVGSGAGIPGVFSCYLGTSGWIAGTVKQPVDPSYGMFNLKHPNGIDTICIGAMRMTGGNISWVLEAFDEQENKYDKLQELASSAPAGSSGLLYLPYLQGERSPFSDPFARGAFIGLSRDTGKEELYRSVIEGVCYGLASIHDRMSTGIDDHDGRLVVSGGGAENAVFTGILASVIGDPVQVTADAAQNGILGNVVIAGNALKWFDTCGMPDGFLKISGSIEPDEEDMKTYQGYRNVFDRLYPALQDEYRNIAELKQ